MNNELNGLNRFWCGCILVLTFAVTAMAQERLIVLDEGIWQADNGRVTYFEDGRVVSNQWFRDMNRQKLGDTPNDIIQVSDELIAIAVNWSNIVQFIRPDGSAVAATEDIPNNRRLATDGRYVYVTSYGHECLTTGGMKYFERGFVAKIDVQTFNVVAATEVGYEPEGIALYDGHLFVANTGGYADQENHEYESTVSILDAATMQLVRNVDTHVMNLYGEMSQSGPYLCINSPGDHYSTQPTMLIFDCAKALHGSADCYVRLDHVATYNCATREGKFLAVGSAYSYTTSEYVFDYLTIDPAQVMQSRGASGVSQTMPGQLKATLQQMSQPYGIYQNPYTGYIYATDASAYADAGYLYQFNAEGQLLGQHKVYINPGHFLALPPDGMSFSSIYDLPIDDLRLAVAVYDLQGRKYKNGKCANVPMNKGVYIWNGKKYINR